MKYEKDIIELLQEIGDAGLPLQSIVKHVYNAHNSFFEPVKEQNVYQSVRSYLIRNSSSPYSLFIKGEDKKYRINPNSSFATSQLLKFNNDDSSTQQTSAQKPPVLPFEED